MGCISWGFFKKGLQGLPIITFCNSGNKRSPVGCVSNFGGEKEVAYAARKADFRQFLLAEDCFFAPK